MSSFSFFVFFVREKSLPTLALRCSLPSLRGTPPQRPPSLSSFRLSIYCVKADNKTQIAQLLTQIFKNKGSITEGAFSEDLTLDTFNPQILQSYEECKTMTDRSKIMDYPLSYIESIAKKTKTMLLTLITFSGNIAAFPVDLLIH